MKWLPCGALLLLAASLLAQQQGLPPYNSPPESAPQTPPQEQAPAVPAPPDQTAPSTGTNQEIQQRIQKDLNTEPVLVDSVVDVTVDDNMIVLMGTVGDEQQHATALRIALPYAGERVIVDAIQPQAKSGYHL